MTEQNLGYEYSEKSVILREMKAPAGKVFRRVSDNEIMSEYIVLGSGDNPGNYEVIDAEPAENTEE